MPKFYDESVDLFEKTISPKSRSGSTIQRIAQMRKANVSPDVIALQMTKNSPTGQIYTEADVLAYEKMYQDCKTKVVITKAQTTALIQNQSENIADKMILTT